MNTRSPGRFVRRGATILALSLAIVAPAMAGVGDLDTQFGVGGQVQVAGNVGPYVLELSDGRILVIGSPTSNQASAAPGRELALNRYLPSGEPDASFGQGGQVLVALPVDRPSIGAVALQPDGKVVVAGNYWLDGLLPFVARLDASGALDPSFGSGGISKPGGGTEPYYSSLIVLSNSEILAAISDWTSDRIDRFAADGRYLGSLSGAIAPVRMALQSDGRLIVSGYHRTLKKSVVMRLDTNGRLDPTFGQDGFAELESGYTASLSVEPGGDRIVLCGPGVVRLTSDGHPDTTFGVQGTGYVAFGHDAVPLFDYCNRLLTPRGGGVVFVGIRKGQAAGGYDQVFVAALTANGTVDTRFGAGSGASEINLGEIKGSVDWWLDTSKSFIATRSGNALLTWLTESAAGLKLVRIDIGSTSSGGVASPASLLSAAPAPTSPTSSTPTPSPTPTVNGGGSHGGGGAFGWFELALFGFGMGGVARSRRKAARRVAWITTARASAPWQRGGRPMLHVASVMALLALAGCASQQAQVKPAPAAQSAKTPSPVVTLAEARRLGYRIADENGKTVYCRDEVATGSHVRKETLCLTAEELAEARDASARNLEQMQRLTPPPACSRFSKTTC
jgi:uncharacterized delta-60 repeat protein